MSAELVVPNEDEIPPVRPIPREEIEEVLMWHRELCEPMRMIFNRALRIGFKLRRWHDLIPHGRWAEWCEINLPEIHERTIRRYVQLWDNRQWLESKLQIGHVSDLEELPTIREALALLAKKRAAERPAKAKENRWRRLRNVAVVVTSAVPSDPDDHGSGDSEIKRCPMCAQPVASIERN